MQLTLDAAARLVELVEERRSPVDADEAARVLFAVERVPQGLARTLLEEISGSETLLHAETGGGAGGAAITAQLPGVQRHALGAPIDLFLAGARLYAFSPEGPLLTAPPSGRPSPTLDGAAHGTH